MMQLDAQESQVVLRLLCTKGVGTRTLDRVLSATARDEPNLIGLPQLSGSELSTRFHLSLETAEAFLGDRSRAEQVWERLRERNVVMLIKGRADYPAHLCSTLGREAPPVLFAAGNIDLLRKPAVGFCGSRKTLETGLAITATCAATLASRGINIVSGYAHGVDLAAHRSALEAGGLTTIVLEHFPIMMDHIPRRRGSFDTRRR